ncbi:MAG: sugar transferase [Symploca sp. SIO3E6]|nr:sugar transferase [Caldora sp. SIO3E6]
MSKRTFDLFFALIGLIILAPLFLVVSIWIKLDSPGPVFFRQTRIGQFEEKFQIYKFRTMVVHAEKIGKLITVGEDNRITRSGKFLRKFKLDELPQLINVLKGDMSFVGYRPEVPKYVNLYTPEQREIFEIRPGVTDLASIKFRNESDLLATAKDPEDLYISSIMPQKLELNRQYLTKKSLLFDILIILQTFLAIFKIDIKQF